MSSRRRTFRIAEQVREILAWEIQRAADPRFHLVTITSVVLSPDLRSGKVYWIVSGDEDKRDDIAEAFEAASGHFKRALSKGLKLRFIPELIYFYDDTLDITDNVARLLEKARVNDTTERDE